MDEKLKQHGAISWSELLTVDVAAAKSFYETLFGWNYEDTPTDCMTYTIVKANGEEVAGIMSIPPEAGPMPPAWGMYVTVDDVDDASQKAVDLGGKILMPPKDIPEVGRFCVISDPQGALLSIISYF
ncbi:MAG: VOC family protein [Desulfatitalea sp.]|nr:VOC family protein [Desulfatitalea sp.]NNJ99822.1 VOC family protein [Desulfatitalea sp.]